MPIFINLEGRTINLTQITHIDWDARSDNRTAVKVFFAGGDWLKITPVEGEELKQTMLSLGRAGTIHY